MFIYYKKQIFQVLCTEKWRALTIAVNHLLTNYYLLLYFCNASHFKITLKWYKLTCRLNSGLYCNMFDKTAFVNLILHTEHLLILVLTKVEAGDMNQLASPLVQHAQSLRFHTVPHKLCAVVHVCTASTLELETVGSDSQCHCQMHRKFKSCLDFVSKYWTVHWFISNV